MAGKRPINADLPAADAPPEGTSAAPAKSESKASTAKPIAPKPAAPRTSRKAPKPRRRQIPAALKAIGGLVLVAVVFLIAAILGGGGSNDNPGKPAPVSTPAPSGPASQEKQTPAAEAAEELGYPSFATNNTTRIGGSDPATTAAAVSLAVFPSTTNAQRPTAVVLANEDEWQGAIAASVLMAAPVRAPSLIGSDSGLPEPTSQALAALDPQGSKETGGAQAFAVGATVPPEGLKTTRVKGTSPAALAASIATLRDRLFGEPPQHVVIASEENSAYAMPAAAWAARSGDPVLFTGAGKLPAATAKALKRFAKVPVYILGPSSVISSGVFREVGKTNKRVSRVSGEDPVENAIGLARYSNGGFGWNVNDPGHGFVLARSDAAIDAAVAAPLSASGTWGPLLLTDDAGTLPAALREYMLDVKPGYMTDPTRAFYNHVWVIGDQEAIDVNQQAEIDQLAELAKIGGEP
jgi:hypothetical protein